MIEDVDLLDLAYQSKDPKIDKLEEENQKIKQLLRDCRGMLYSYRYELGDCNCRDVYTTDLITKIDEVLQ